MASVDGSRSLHGASDEIYDIICVPCKNDNIEKQAEHYCENCKEYLCGPCKEYHRRLTVTKNHKILSGSLVPKTGSIKQPKCGVYCSCSQNREVEMYCEDHGEVLCSSCESVKHRKCKTQSLEEKSQNYSSTRYTALLEKTRSLKKNIDDLKKKRTEDARELDSLKAKCREEIKMFRKELDNVLDKLENDTLKELDTYKNEHLQCIEKHISTLATAFQMLDSDIKTLEDAGTGGQKTSMFALDIKVSKGLKEYETLLDDTKKDVLKPYISFVRNNTLAEIETKIKSLGYLKRYDKKVMLGLKVQSSSQIHIKSPNTTESWMSGSVFLSNSHIVVCINNEKNIKLLDSSWAVQKELKLSSGPFDVSLINDNEIIVSLPEEKQLQYIQVLPQLKVGRVIQLDKTCFAIDVSGDEIYTTCCNDEMEGEVRVLDLNGNMKRRIGLNEDGSFIFKTPFCLAVNPVSKKIVVSDLESLAVTSLTMEGDIISQYKDEDLKSPAGILVDAEDNIIVCDRESNNVHIITAVGKRYGTLVASSAGLKAPLSIAFRANDGTLIVGCFEQNSIFVLKLA